MAHHPHPTYDLVLDGIGLMLSRLEGGKGRAWSIEGIEDRQYPLVLTREYTSLHNGSFHSERKHPGTNEYSTGVDASEPHGRVAAGAITQLTLSATVGGTPDTVATADVEEFVELPVSGTRYVWVIGGRYLYRLNSDLTVHTTGYDLGAGVAGQGGVAFGGNLLVACGSGAAFRSFSGTAVSSTFTGSAVDSDDDKADYFAVTHANDRLARAHDTGDVRYLTEGVAPLTRTNWTARYAVDEPNTPITALVAWGLDVLVGKEDGLFAIQRDTRTPNLTPELRALRDPNNMKKMVVWAGRLWAPFQQGLLWWADGEYGSANLSIGAWHSSPVWGRVLALAPAGQWLYVALYDSVSSPVVTWLVKCRLRGSPGYENDPPGGPLVGTVIAKLSDYKVNALRVSSVPTNPTLFLGYTKVSTSAYNAAYMTLPRFGAQASQDSGVTYQSGGIFYFGTDDLGMGGQPFLLQELEVEAQGLSGADYLSYLYKLDDGSWQTVGADGQIKTSPKTTISFDWDASGVGRRFALREDWTLSGATATPTVRRVTVRGVPRPTGNALITAVVDVGEGVVLRNRTRDARRTDWLITRLNYLKEAGAPVTLQDLVGNTRTVVVMKVQEQETEQAGDLPRAARVTLTLRQLGTTTSVQNPGVYGSAVYGTNTYA